MSEKNRIGSKVKLIRENRKLSIGDVSERTNLSVKSIESIENGELIPIINANIFFIWPPLLLLHYK